MDHNKRLIAVQQLDSDESFVLGFYDKLQQYCRFLTQDSWDGDDLAQEAILKAIKHYEPKEINPQLLKKIAYHQWIDTVRKRKREEPNHPIDGNEMFSCCSKIDTVELLMERLTPKQAVVFLLKEGFNYQSREIAGLLGMAETAVKAILYRARKRLDRNGGLQGVESVEDEREKQLLASVLNDSLRTEDPAILIERISELPSLQPASPTAMALHSSSNLSTFCMAA
ncbi:sigma-70 family RNA polymerase sigma factor [Bacillus sp. REN3]|uniref:sigma-70 family RNA polymerase sigma factor n=1 Tax=Bacillus sp. REN3 TaxID=2802440 RepID=UPI001AEDB96F|nr:sigma-70 family RNA polymerase sigma factor [Bacillus sp. REN3]